LNSSTRTIRLRAGCSKRFSQKRKSMRKIWSACCRSSVIDTRCVEAHLQTMCVGACNSYMHAAIFLLHVAVWCGGQPYLDIPGPGPVLMSADSLTGDSVVSTTGEDLGEIEAIMLDVPRGRVAYAVLSFGGFLGMGDKLFAIPWDALTLDAERECFILDVEKDRLKNAPGFDKDHWPAMADMQWASDIHSYYVSRPYWEQDRI